MKIVGVGCGPGMLTGEAITAIAGATLVYGSRRAIDLASAYIAEGAEVHEIRDYGSLRSLPDHAVVLSTGDPMLAGLGHLGGEVVPGISSLQVAAARIHIPIWRISVVTAHGRDHEAAMKETVAEISRGKVVFLVADPDFDVRKMAARLIDAGDAIVIVLAENLGYPDERIVRGSPADPPVPESDMFCLVLGMLEQL
jgi:cobalt-precorrin-7 (C5)-methyltransferase